MICNQMKWEAKAVLLTREPLAGREKCRRADISVLAIKRLECGSLLPPLRALLWLPKSPRSAPAVEEQFRSLQDRFCAAGPCE